MKSEGGKLLSKNIIDGEQDDDCATDLDVKRDAEKMLNNEFYSAVSAFMAEKKDGSVSGLVKNYNCKQRFAKTPF
jgi:hypothetical protein